MSLHLNEEKTQKFPPQKFKLNGVDDRKQDLEDAEPHLRSDEVDALRKDPVCRWFDIVFLLISITTYVVDLATDGFVAAKYYLDGDIWYFSLTLAFVALPAIVTSVVSAKWYLRDRKSPIIVEEKVSAARWIARIFCLLFFLSPVIRYVESLHYGLLSRKSKSKQNKLRAAQYFARMAHEDADASFLRLFESYLESAPQLVLQLYIMVLNAKSQKEEPLILIILQAASVVTSVISLAWSLTSYNRILRYAQNDKRNIRWGSSVILFLSHLFVIVARVLPLSLFASVYTWFIWPVCLFHWALMSIWIVLQKTSACTTKTEEVLFDILIGVIHLFTFFNVKTGKTRNRYIFYYAICFVENSILMSLWFYEVITEEQLWFYYPALVGQFASFIIGIILLAVYHKRFHPNVHPRVAICMRDAVCASADNQAEGGAQVPTRLGRFDVVRDIDESSQENAI